MLQIVKWIVILLVTTISMLAQDTFTNKEGSQYQFKTIMKWNATPVEDQSQTGTCWSFSSMSFIESEIMRLGGKPVDLSEMYVVRNAYVAKAENYLRMNGKCQFGSRRRVSRLIQCDPSLRNGSRIGLPRTSITDMQPTITTKW
jgi:aminopeptidase C